MEDDTILIEENEVLTLPSERVNSHHLPNIFKKREHISNKIVDDQKLQPFKEALGDYQVKRANSPIKTPSTGREYDPLFTELNDLMETNPRQLNFDTEAADTLRLVDKKSEDSQQDSGNRLKLNKEGSSSKINYDSDHDSDGSRYSYSRLASIATGLQHKKSDRSYYLIFFY